MSVTEKHISEADELLLLIRRNPLPRHIAIIMDGNGRWAKQHGLASRIRGHREGVKSVREVTTACAELGLQALTLYAFSKENWKRPQVETGALMKLLDEYLIKERPTLMDNDIRLIASGHLEDLPPATLALLQDTIKATAHNSGMYLNLALSYGGRHEIVDAARRLAEMAKRGEINPSEITADVFQRHLYSPFLPEPDLLIRTSGEMRISNFLLWQIAYTEIYVAPVLWPDFRKADLYRAILDYQRRDRRFGMVADEPDGY
ncbi:MAG: isoprenyl transferase [Candidatus Sumerlaeia bacterium]